jgi:ABC-type nickel/cobalt efflux system permease component RcnA
MVSQMSHTLERQESSTSEITGGLRMELSGQVCLACVKQSISLGTPPITEIFIVCLSPHKHHTHTHTHTQTHTHTHTQCPPFLQSLQEKNVLPTAFLVHLVSGPIPVTRSWNLKELCYSFCQMPVLIESDI